MKYAAFVFKSLLRSKRRTILTVLSIAVSLFVFSALMSLPSMVNQVLAESASSLRVVVHNEEGLTYSLPEAYKRKIAAIPHVIGVAPLSWFGGIYHELNDQFDNMAYDPESVDVVFPDYGLSKEVIEKFKATRTACLVGRETMKRFHWSVGQQIMLRGTVYPFNLTFTIVGVLGGKAPATILMFRRDYLEEAYGRPGFVDIYFVRVDKASSLRQVSAAIDAQFADSSAETKTESEDAFMGGYLDQYRMVFRLARGLGLIVILTIGLVAANTAAMSIRERRGEIAILRSIGFPSRTILALLLSESLLIG
ncbi:MAG TPA: ABC transporter permease, partial [Candidatus Binataceae bacterium]|nr:ABC transporter permease [Candidatus Binataceae bacterium]